MTDFVLRTAALLSLTFPGGAVMAYGSADAAPSRADRPSITLKATPLVAFSPARISVRAELKGGADDFEQYYCSSVEWEWGDGTVSETTTDCDPYEAGKSEIRRYYSGTHTFTTAGRYQVRFKLKKGDKVVGGGVTTVQVRGGIRDMPPF
jgi:hypothetical protein